jgi:hypothetical protein
MTFSLTSVDLRGTAGRNAIPTHGGFNKNEYNIQIRDARNNSDSSGYSGQDHQHVMYSGRNPLNPPSSTTDTGKQYGINDAYGWREDKLRPSLPAFVESNTVELSAKHRALQSVSNQTHLQMNFRHGFGQNDPALQHLISEQNIAPQIQADYWSHSDEYLHSDIGVPSMVNQNLIETATSNNFPADKVQITRGNHKHHNLTHSKTPKMHNRSHTSTGTHYRSGNPTHPVIHGTVGPLQRPTLLSDFPSIKQPDVRPQDSTGEPQITTNRRVFLFA